MALIDCPECGRREVSDLAPACPQCGAPIGSRPSSEPQPGFIDRLGRYVEESVFGAKTLLGAILVVAFLLLALAIFLIAGGG